MKVGNCSCKQQASFLLSRLRVVCSHTLHAASPPHSASLTFPHCVCGAPRALWGDLTLGKPFRLALLATEDLCGKRAIIY